MVIDCGMRYASDAESAFVFNVISQHKNSINKGTFVSWATDLEHKSQKRLIQYSQYLNTAKMRIES